MKTTLNELENFLDLIKKETKKLNNIILHNADARCGKLVALAIRNNKTGSIAVKTEFLSYTEMNYLLQGYYFSIKKVI